MTDSFCQVCGALLSPTDRHCWSCAYPISSLPFTLLHRRYLLTGRLGQGGMGTVFKAVDTALQQKVVAIKQVAGQQALQQELALLPQLDHPHIPSVSDYFQEAGNHYLVMRYIEGQDLEAHLDNQPAHQLPFTEVVQIGVTLCDVLGYLHGLHPPIIFRDVKPGNVLLTPQGKLFLVDFGIARVYKACQAKDTQAMGSPGYAPPEQYNRGQTDARSDLYALGALLYYLATGDDPATHPFQFTRSLVSQASLWEVIRCATHLDPAQRYANASQMQAALHACLLPAAPLPSSPSALAPSVVPRRSVLWVFAPEDERIVKKLETHLAPLRRKYALTFLHNTQEQRSGATEEEKWRYAFQQAFLVGLVHSPSLEADDLLVQVRDTLLLPEARRTGTIVVPLIGRFTSTDGSIPYALQSLPRGRKGLLEMGDDGYVEVATDFRHLAAQVFGF